MSRGARLFSSVITGDSNSFRSRYEAADFAFSHDLATNPIFDLSSLQQLLARRSGRQANCYWSSGAVDVQDPWNAGTRYRSSLHDTLLNIATNSSLVILKNVETDTLLGPFVQRVFEELGERVGARLQKDIIKRRATLLIASPHRTTSYHLDGDTNFLFQVRGGKLFHVLSKHDRRVIPDAELEAYFGGDPNAAIFKDSHGHAARSYRLAPGSGIHIPSTAPHWAHTLDSVSVALSVNFDLRSIEQRARVYRVNARLRALGLHPTPPGRSMAIDRLKLAAYGLMRAARRATPAHVRVTGARHSIG